MSRVIFDSLSHIRRYFPLVPHLEQGFGCFLRSRDLPDGSYPFEGGVLILGSGETVPIEEKRPETHRTAADVMILLEGSECIGYCAEDRLGEVEEDLAPRDCRLHSQNEPDIAIRVPAGYFYVFLPGEGHKPGVHCGHPGIYRKAILKCECEKETGNNA